MSAAILAALEKLTTAVQRLDKAVRQPERRAYRPAEVAEMTGIGYEVVLDLIHAGELQALKVGRLHVVPSVAIDQLLARAETADVVVLDGHRRPA
jgi:excisionase family DNA binding protein